MSDQVVDHLNLDGRFMRSMSLERDLDDSAALDTYLVTPAAIAALHQVVHGLREKRPQRAWKIIGPYGSGKSALGILLAQLLEGPKNHRKLYEKITEESPETAQSFRRCTGRLPLAIVGSRSSLSESLALRVAKRAESWPRGKATNLLRKRLDLDGMRYAGRKFSASCADMLEDFVAAAKEQGHTGVLLLVDELGKFIEHAALYPDEGDLIALQQIAELACRPTDDSLAVVTMLHRHFEEYANAVGRSLSDEWQKVAARFDEIAFDEPIERYVHFAAHALGVSPALQANKVLRAQAKALYEEAGQRGVLRLRSARDAELRTKPQVLYPLHPLSIVALAVVAKRFGQSERSFHAFLRGHEPSALRAFAVDRSIRDLSWFCLPQVFDFIAAGYGLRFRDLSIERRWTFARESIQRLDQNEAATTAVLKSIAVLELVHSSLRVSATTESLEFALRGVLNQAQIREALGVLVKRELLLHRRQSDEYCFAVSDAINLEALYEVAGHRSDRELMLLGISRTLSERLVIANRHYDRTGTLRTVAVAVGSIDKWSSRDMSSSSTDLPDGYLDLIFVDEGEKDHLAKAMVRVKAVTDPAALTCLVSLTASARLALVEYSKWIHVQEQVTRKRIDPWTNRYVDLRLAELKAEVDRRVLSQFAANQEGAGPVYWHCGTKVQGSASMNMSRAASWLFDTLFSQTPFIVNELINKDRPAPPIVLARQRLLEQLLSRGGQGSLFGDEEFPPERLILSTLLVDTGIFRIDAGESWSLGEPTAGAPVDITHAWREIERVLAKGEQVSVADMLSQLARPPLGIRAGPAGVWLMSYLLVRRGTCALFERGTFILEVTIEHLARMFKSPGTFHLREVGQDAEHQRLLHDYKDALAVVGYEPEGALSYLEVARACIRWVTRLPAYASESLDLSVDAKLVRGIMKRAQDPIELLTTSLPEAFKARKGSEQEFSRWLASLLSETSMMHRRLQEAVGRMLSEALEIRGSLKLVRAQLQQESIDSVGHLADPRLKSFLLRCADLTLTDERWLDSVASLLVQRPIDAWGDDTLPKFEQALIDLCGHYKRWLKLVKESGRNPRAAQRFLSLTLTLPGGTESSVFVADSERADGIAKKMVGWIAKETGGDTKLTVAAIAQAFLLLQPASPQGELSEHANQKLA